MPRGVFHFLKPPVTEQLLGCVSPNILCSVHNSGEISYFISSVFVEVVDDDARMLIGSGKLISELLIWSFGLNQIFSEPILV